MKAFHWIKSIIQLFKIISCNKLLNDKRIYKYKKGNHITNENLPIFL